MTVSLMHFSLATDRQLMPNAVKAILSTILFQRLFGSLVPDVKEASGVSYPTANNAEADQIITEKLRELSKALRTSDKARITIKLFQRKVKKATWFAKTQDVCWEDWTLDVSAVSPTGDINASTQTQLQTILMKIVAAVETEKEHIPPITTTDATPFPYEITVHEI